MDWNLYIAFVLLSIGIIALPGPNVLFIAATSLSSGRSAGLLAVAGTSSAMAIQLLVATMGTAALASILSDTFIWVKWLGVGYLAYLGIGHLLASRRRSDQPVLPRSAKRAYWQGFFVSLTNPKTILFFGALLPQFVSGAYPAGPQLAVLALSFFVLAVMLDSLYAISAAAVKGVVDRPLYAQGRNLVVGLIYLGASLGFALTRRTAA